MKSTIPQFNSQRMVMDYINNFYGPAKEQGKRLGQDNGTPAKVLANWKRKVRKYWPKVKMRRLDNPPDYIQHDATLPIRVAAFLNSLHADDVRLECLVGVRNQQGELIVHDRYELEAEGKEGDEMVFSLNLKPRLPGMQIYQLRMYPSHPLMSHPLESGDMIWL